MLTHYLVLGLLPGASDEDVRRHYLNLVRRYSPERDPKRFEMISRAYEALGDRRSRIRSALFGIAGHVDSEHAFDALMEACQPPRQTPGLADLLACEGKGEKRKGSE